MKSLFTALLLALSIASVHAQHPWQQLTIPTAKEAASNFQSPPPEYGMILWWGWDGAVNDTVIMRDLDKIKSMGFQGVMIEAGYGMRHKYLSPGWFKLIKFAVEQAKLRGMRVWDEDEGKYPSGFAGGKFSAERPDLKMQGLVVTDRIEVRAGETISRKLPASTLSAIAINTDNNDTKTMDIRKEELNWLAPNDGNWKIILAGPEFRTAPTRSVNNPTKGKDTSASLFDYLNPEATRQFIAWTHEQYKKYIGDEFGKTFMGLMGDEPDFAYTPWTPRMLDEFKTRKGYDVQPYLASFFVPKPSESQRRAKADYWDVWSSLFGLNFFKVQGDWCRENNLDYIVHLNHEEAGPQLVKSEGDYFKNMRYVGVPGVDVIWSQIWMDHVADYPKLASSAAHAFGRPRAFTESFAAFTYRPTVPQAKWVLDYELVRGINSVQIMFMSASTRKAVPNKGSVADSTVDSTAVTTGNKPVTPKVRRSSFFMSDTFPPVARYVNRATYLLSVGRPAAQIALYFPTSSMWMGDNESNTSCLAIVQKLMETQHDFDFVDEQGLSSVFTVEKGALNNLSGQTYNTVIVPSITVMSKAALEHLQEFAKTGGKVIFLGRKPSLAKDQTFLDATPPAGLDWAMQEASGELTQKVLEALPKPDVLLDKHCPSVKYLHRKLADADVYFFFNESQQSQSFVVNLRGKGQVSNWDAMTGEIKKTEGVRVKKETTIIPLSFAPWETKFIVIGK
jgi:hypothetical protein